MAGSQFKTWLAASVLGIAITGVADAQDLCTRPLPPPGNGIVVDICIGRCGIVAYLVLEFTSDEGREIVDLVASDLSRSGIFQIVDPSRPNLNFPEPDVTIRLSTSQLDDGTIGVDMAILDFATGEPLTEPCPRRKFDPPRS